MIKYLIYGLIFYFLIRFIFNFLIPVIRTGRQMSRQMRDFQSKMQQPAEDAPIHETKTKAGDYIDFEEIKD